MIDPSVFIAAGVCIIGSAVVKRDASLWFQAVVRADVNAISIGERTNVQDGTVIHVTHEHPTVIGNDVTIGHRAIVHGCTVGDGSLIGMGAILLDGTTVGPAALVAAGALVREGFAVPAGTLAAGVPARIIRELTPAERSALMASAEHYVGYAAAYRQQITAP